MRCHDGGVMPLPDYQSLMLPLLQLAADDAEYTVRTAIDTLGSQLHLTDVERGELLPSGRQPVFDNRVGWAKTYLAKAGLLASPQRGRFRITPTGHELLSSHPARITSKMLEHYDAFRAFRDSAKSLIAPAVTEGELQTPEELIEQSIEALNASLRSELQAMVASCSPRFFEQLVVDLLLKMGYGGSRREAGAAVGQSGDGGIDGIIKEDLLGLDSIYIQAKRWDGPVGRPVVQAFVGSLEGRRARRGVLITTSNFSQQAIEYVQRIEKTVILIDGKLLVQLMIDHSVGVNTESNYVVKRVDRDYFDPDGVVQG
jgi:restriction system protein